MTQVKPVRSPSYPSTSLGDAVDQVRKIEEKYRGGAVDREAAAKLIGYSSLSGPANKALAALAAYCLVERAGKGEMRVTSLAQDILYSDFAGERRACLRKAAFEPSLFRELQERWPNMAPPEDGVIMYLNRQGFNQSAVVPAARAYLDTLVFLEQSGASESYGEEGSSAPESPGPSNPENQSMPEAATMERTRPSTPQVSPSAMQSIADALSAPQLNRIDMNIQGDKVHLNGLLDVKGLDALEKKIAALRVLLDVYTVANDTGSDDDG